MADYTLTTTSTDTISTAFHVFGSYVASSSSLTIAANTATSTNSDYATLYIFSSNDAFGNRYTRALGTTTSTDDRVTAENFNSNTTTSNSDTVSSGRNTE